MLTLVPTPKKTVADAIMECEAALYDLMLTLDENLALQMRETLCLAQIAADDPLMSDKDFVVSVLRADKNVLFLGRTYFFKQSGAGFVRGLTVLRQMTKELAEQVGGLKGREGYAAARDAVRMVLHREASDLEAAASLALAREFLK